MTTKEMIAAVAERADVSLDVARQVLKAQSKIVSSRAAESAPVPGIGVAWIEKSPATTLVMRFGPKAGQTIALPAKTRVKFQVAAPFRKSVRDGTSLPAEAIDTEEELEGESAELLFHVEHDFGSGAV